MNRRTRGILTLAVSMTLAVWALRLLDHAVRRPPGR